MPMELVAAAIRLSDADLLRRVAELAGCARHATVALIAHLAELDRRKLFRGQGYGSLFSYCTGALRLSEHAAYNRIEAARASRAFPAVLDGLARGDVNLSTLRLLAPHFTQENHERLLSEARGRSKREVEVQVARLAPRPDVAPSVRRLPVASVPPGQAVSLVPMEQQIGSSGTAIALPAATFPPPPNRPVIVPLSAERYRIQLTVSRETQDKLRRLQDLLRREVPDGDPAVIVDRALTLLLDDVARRKLAAAARPRPSRAGDPRSRHVPAAVKRGVWLRDHGQCAFVSPAGRRCRERTFLEFHHVEPYGLGGETTVHNLSLRCRVHNVYEAELVFGPREAVVGSRNAARGGVALEPQRLGLDSPRGESPVSG